MKTVKRVPCFDHEKCIGCTICSKVCPTDAIEFTERKPAVRKDDCAGCGLCESHCPKYAIQMNDLDTPRVIQTDADQFDQEKIKEICLKAHFFPEQVICVCTHTKAREVAAAILAGAKTPIDLARMTGIRTGCGCDCAATPLRMLEAAGIEVGKAPGWQWTGAPSTLWTLSDEVKEKYSAKYYFDKDIDFCEECIEKGLVRGEGK